MTFRVENSNNIKALTEVQPKSSEIKMNNTISFGTQHADQTPKPQRDQHDKRPNIEDRIDNAWEWINGNFNTEDVLSVNNQGYFVELKVAHDTEEGIVTDKYKITKSNNSTTIICNNGDGTQFTYVVDNKSGKLEYLIYGGTGEAIHYKSDGSKELIKSKPNINY